MADEKNNSRLILPAGLLPKPTSPKPLRASDKRNPYQLRRNPADEDLPIHFLHPKRHPILDVIDRKLIGVVVMALECKNSKGQTLICRETALVHSDKVGDWDYNTLEPYLIRLETMLTFMAKEKRLNPVRFIDPARIPQPAVKAIKLI